MRKEIAIKCQRVNDIIVFAEDLALFPAPDGRSGAHDLLQSGQQSFLQRGKLRAAESSGTTPGQGQRRCLLQESSSRP